MAKHIELKDPELDTTDAHTRLFLLAEYWKREAMRMRKLLEKPNQNPGSTTEFATRQQSCPG